MLSSGGFEYPSKCILILLSIVAVLVTALIWWMKSLPFFAGLALLLGLEGTALLASSYTPVGLAPPPRDLKGYLLWFITNPKDGSDVGIKGTSVSFDKPMFFSGILFIFLSYISGALAFYPGVNLE
jgi:hypothetical protein